MMVCMALLLGLQGRNSRDPLVHKIPEDGTLIHRRRRGTIKSTSNLGNRASYQQCNAPMGFGFGPFRPATFSFR